MEGITHRLNEARHRIEKLMMSFEGTEVLVVGDLTLDEFMTGEVERLSREAPVLILRHEQTHQIPGGGANAAYNLAKLGARVKVVGVVGKDIQGKALLGIFEEAGIDTTGIVSDGNRPTVTKTRISGHARQSVTQQIVRIDRKSDYPLSLEVQQQLATNIQDKLGNVAAVVCSDYLEGVFTEKVIVAALNHPQVIVDTQKGLHRYPKATLFTPNLPEAELAVGYPITDEVSLQKAGEDLLKLTEASHMLITRGEEGMSLFSYNEGIVVTQEIPAFNRTEVFDVTGAGDTVVAALTLVLCRGGSLWEAAVIGNLAASIVVRKFGTATTSKEEMNQAWQKMIEKMNSQKS